MRTPTYKLFESFQSNLKETEISHDIKSFHIENMGGGTMALFGQFTDGRFFAGNEDGLNVYDIDVWPYYEVDEEESGVNWQELEDKHNVETIEAGTELFNKIMRETKFMDLDESEELKESEINPEVQAILTGPLHGENVQKIKELGYSYNNRLGLISNRKTGKGIELAHFPMGEKSNVSVTVFTDLYGANTTKETFYFDSIADIDLNLQEILDTPSNIEECEKPLKEDVTGDNIIKLYMNTWANYNEYGADTESIGGGWMTIEQAKEFLENHKEEEPFINDTDNCPISVSEYDNPWQVIENLETIENIDPSDRDAFLAILEDQNDNVELAMSILESREYTFFPGVDNDYELGKAYYDMVGGIEGINSPENYINREYVKQNLINNMTSDEDYSDETIDAMVDEDIEVAKIDNDESFFENYFDFEALGRELDYSGFFFAETGALQTY